MFPRAEWGKEKEIRVFSVEREYSLKNIVFSGKHSFIQLEHTV